MYDHFKGIKRYVDILNTEKVSNKAWLISTALNKNNFELREVRVYIEGSSYSKCMKEIQGKSILVRVSARFELSGVNCTRITVLRNLINLVPGLSCPSHFLKKKPWWLGCNLIPTSDPTWFMNPNVLICLASHKEQYPSVIQIEARSLNVNIDN